MFRLTSANVFILLCICYMNTDATADGSETVAVSLSPHISTENLPKLRESLINLLESASKLLFQSTGNRTFLKQVHIHVPESWSEADLQKFRGNLTEVDLNNSISFELSDIRVDRANPLYGDRPYTHQTNMCGQRGHFIHFTEKYLTDTRIHKLYGIREKLFVNNWMRLRYGVFEEYGYEGDPIYPRVYNVDDTHKVVTGCRSDERPLRSSLMSVVNSLTVDEFCGSHRNYSHVTYLPTRQNFLCDFSSVWDVVSKSVDFKDKLNSNRATSIDFKVAKRPKLDGNEENYAVLIDKSTNDNRSKILYESLKYFQQYAIDSKTMNKFWYVPFGKSADIFDSLDRLNSSRLQSDEACIECAIKMAQSTDKSGKSRNVDKIILVTAGNTKFGDIKSLLGTMTLFVILYPSYEITVADDWLKIAENSGGNFYFIDEHSKVDSIKSIFQSLSAIYTKTGLDNYRLKYIMSEANENNSTTGSLYFNSDEDKLLMYMIGGSYHYSLKSQKTEIRYTTENEPDLISVETPHISKGKWIYDISSRSWLMIIIEERNKNVFQASSWKVELNDNKTVVFYAQLVSQNYRPVIKASVRVEYTLLSEALVRTTGWVSLYDNGNGDPDLTKNDGVYSGYFTPYNKGRKGLYQTKIVVTGKAGETFINLYNSSSRHACCGSRVPVTEKEDVSNFSFEIISSSLVRDTSSSNLRRKPSRIGDLVATKIGNVNGTVSVEWTAPGDDLTDGTASSYDLRITKNLTGIFEGDYGEKITADVNDVPIVPHEAGTKECFIIRVNKTESFYLTVRAVNNRKESSLLSNIAFVRKADKHTDVLVVNKVGFAEINTWLIVGLVLLAFMFVCLLLFVYVRKRNRSIKSSKDANKLQQRSISASKSQGVYSVQDTISHNMAELDKNASYDNPSMNITPDLDDNHFSRKSFRRITLV